VQKNLTLSRRQNRHIANLRLRFEQKILEGDTVVDRRLKAFVGRQIDRLLDAAKDCNDPELQGDILQMAEYWIRQSVVDAEERLASRGDVAEQPAARVLN
jgi:hypothetical protein